MLLISLLVAIQLEAVTRVDATTPEAIQVALAESAAPPRVASDASVYEIGPNGYRKVRDGRNGFTCLVRERKDTVEPECFDAEGTATVVPVRLFVEARRAAGADNETIDREVDEAYRAGRFIRRASRAWSTCCHRTITCSTLNASGSSTFLVT